MTQQELQEKSIELTLKRCPKCHGKMFLEADTYGYYESCLCGFHRDIDSPTAQEKEDWGMKK